MVAWKKSKGTQEIHFAFGQIPFAKRIAIMGKEQTMSDLIKRSDAIKALDNAWINGTSLLDANEAVKQLKDLPSADRPQGEWIEDKSKNIWNMVVDCYKCSNCGIKTIDHSLILDTTGLSYCPNCGARMKGADDE